MKKIISLISVLAIILMLFSFGSVTASAATSSLHFSSNTVEVGSQVTVTVNLQNNTEMVDASCKITYQESILKFDSGNATSGGAGILNFVSDKSANKYTITLTFTAIATGESPIQVKDCMYTYIGNNESVEENFSGQSAVISVKDKGLSDNANLKSLSINVGSISPKFSPNKTSYTAKVPYSITKVNVTAKAEDNGAKVVSVEGNNDLKIGRNNIVVTVQAPNGTIKKYTIIVTRADENEVVNENQEPEDQSSALQTTLDDVSYTVVREIPEEALFKGFSVSTAKYNDVDVSVATDSNGIYKIYYLKSSENEELIPYLYNEETKAFNRLKYTSIGDNVYIFEKIPDEYKEYGDLYKSNVNISEFTIECFSSNNEKLNKFHYVYCYANGVYGIYRYDSYEGTLQRYPEFRTAEDVDSENISEDNIFERFKSLSTNGKIILICLLIVIIGGIVLVVYFVRFLLKRNKENRDSIIFETFADFDEIDEDLTETED